MRNRSGKGTLSTHCRYDAAGSAGEVFSMDVRNPSDVVRLGAIVDGPAHFYHSAYNSFGTLGIRHELLFVVYSQPDIGGVSRLYFVDTRRAGSLQRVFP